MECCLRRILLDNAIKLPSLREPPSSRKSKRKLLCIVFTQIVHDEPHRATLMEGGRGEEKTGLVLYSTCRPTHACYTFPATCSATSTSLSSCYHQLISRTLYSLPHYSVTGSVPSSPLFYKPQIPVRSDSPPHVKRFMPHAIRYNPISQCRASPQYLHDHSQEDQNDVQCTLREVATRVVPGSHSPKDCMEGEVVLISGVPIFQFRL